MATSSNTAVGTTNVRADGRLEENATPLPIAKYLRMVPTDLEKFDHSDQVILLHPKQTKIKKPKTKPTKKPKTPKKKKK